MKARMRAPGTARPVSLSVTVPPYEKGRGMLMRPKLTPELEEVTATLRKTSQAKPVFGSGRTLMSNVPGSVFKENSPLSPTSPAEERGTMGAPVRDCWRALARMDRGDATACTCAVATGL